MGSGAPGADSSSPSDNPALVEIGHPRAGTAGELRLKLLLSDGSCLFVTERLLAELGLRDLSLPSPLGEEVLAALRRESEMLRTREKAIDLLGRSAHSETSLRLKLRQRRFSPEAIDAVMCWLADRGLLDDRRFAEQWIYSRLERHPESRAALVAGLRRRGVARSAAEEVVRRLVDAEAERLAARRLMGKLRRQGAREEGELYRALAARGFRRSLVRSLLEEDR